MVKKYGMNEKLGFVDLEGDNKMGFLGNGAPGPSLPVSEEAA